MCRQVLEILTHVFSRIALQFVLKEITCHAHRYLSGQGESSNPTIFQKQLLFQSESELLIKTLNQGIMERSEETQAHS